MIFQLYPLFIVLEKPGYIALWVPSVQHPDVFWAYWGGGGGGGGATFLLLYSSITFTVCVWDVWEK